MKFTRSALLVLWALLACASAVVAQGTVTVKVGETSGSPGTQVEIPIDVAGASNIGAMHVELAFNTAVLHPIEVRRGALAQPAQLFDGNLSTPGRVTIGMATTNPINGDGTLAVVVFEVLGQQGDTSALRLENTTANDATSDPPTSVPATLVDGTFQVGDTATGGGSLILVPIFAAMLAAAILITWQVTKRSQQASVGGAPISAGSQLLVTRGQASQNFLRLDRPAITIGRNPASDLALMDDMVSSWHAQIRQEGGGVVLYDLDSTNGTFVNGTRITSPCLLRPGDVIAMGDSELVYQV